MPELIAKNIESECLLMEEQAPRDDGAEFFSDRSKELREWIMLGRTCRLLQSAGLSFPVNAAKGDLLNRGASQTFTPSPKPGRSGLISKSWNPFQLENFATPTIRG
jgi:hypothetical protein